MDNETILKRFLSQREYSDVTKALYEGAMDFWVKWVGKPLLEATKDDLVLWNKKSQEEYDNPRTGKKTTLSLASRDKYASNLKRLYTFYLTDGKGLDEEDAAHEATKLWKVIPLTDIRRKVAKGNHLRKKVITPEEFNALLEGAVHSRFKCAIALAYDTGCKPGELFSLRIRDIRIRTGDVHGTVNIMGKTGERTVPIKHSIPYLKLWLQLHPNRELDSPLFMTKWSGEIKPMNPRSFAKTLGDTAERLGIRHIHPHLFRHSRATDLANKGANEETLRKIFGWTPGSVMPSKYVHMAQTQAISAVLKLDGVDVPEEELYQGIGLWQTKTCPFCEGVVGADLNRCPHCMEFLDPALRPEPVDIQGMEERIVDLEEKQAESMEHLLETLQHQKAAQDKLMVRILRTLETHQGLDLQDIFRPTSNGNNPTVEEDYYRELMEQSDPLEGKPPYLWTDEDVKKHNEWVEKQRSFK